MLVPSASMAPRIFATSALVADSPEQQGLGFHGQHGGDGHQQQADHRGAEGVPDAVAGDQRQADAEEREDQAQQGAEVLQQDDGQLGLLGVADELDPALLAAQRVGLA